jgi:dihydropyrimidine dehydrogenase (NAD+) subunit PreA
LGILEEKQKASSVKVAWRLACEFPRNYQEVLTMVDLSTTYMGIDLKNPLIVAAGPTTQTPEICKKAANAGWAGVVLKTLFPEEGFPSIPNSVPRPMYALVDASWRRKWQPLVPKKSDRVRGKKRGKVRPDYGLVNNFLIGPTGPLSSIGNFFPGDKYLGYINRTKELVGDGCKVIASIYAATESEWEKYCDLVNKSDADMVELNLGCGIAGYLDPKTGDWTRGAIGIHSELVRKWTKFCSERLEKPMGVKLPPSAPSAVTAAKLVEQNGGKGIQFGDAGLLHNMPALVVDPDSLEVGTFPGYPTFSIIVGALLFPFVCGTTANLRLNGINIDISSCGGIRDYMDVIRLLMVGATSTQICVATMVEGVDLGSEFLEEITAWMEKRGYKSISEIQGCLLAKMQTDISKLPAPEILQIMGGPTPSTKVILNEKRCISCGWCEASCSHLAVKMVDKHPRFDDKLCEVCGMCVALCPVGALSIEPRD